MSKGWESKNVEEQQAAATAPAGTRESPAALARDAAARRRHIEGLELQRERLLNEQTSSPHRRSALQAAIATLERDLEQLGWSVKI